VENPYKSAVEFSIITPVPSVCRHSEFITLDDFFTTHTLVCSCVGTPKTEEVTTDDEWLSVKTNLNTHMAAVVVDDDFLQVLFFTISRLPANHLIADALCLKEFCYLSSREATSSAEES
jgi:hypothetical protein